jgi:predicted RNA-binding protein
MDTKRDIENQAKVLIDSNPEEAVILYEKIWVEYNDDFNDWDAFHYLKALRKCLPHIPEFIDAIVEKFKGFEKVNGLYSWYIFDKYVKHIEKKELINNEQIICNSFNITKQKDLHINQDFPCPLTISVFQLADAHSENPFNAKKINNLLDVLNPELLASKPRKLQTADRGEIELASDKEKYYSLKTKALLKLGEYAKCLELCAMALDSLEKFHYNNDLWFKMRQGICHDKLGESEIGEKILNELLSTKAGSDKWFLYRDIAEIYFEQTNYEKAWIFAVNSAYYGNEPQFMINLYLLQTRILYKLNRKEEGELLAKLLYAIIRENGWNIKPEYSKLFSFYYIKGDDISNVGEYLKSAKEFWSKERYKGIKRESGQIVWIHDDGKKGKIKSINGSVRFFSKKDIRTRIKDLKSMKNSTVEYFPMVDFKGDLIAEDVLILENEKQTFESSDLVGKNFTGKIKSVVDFGIFVSIPEMKDGLLHRSNFKKSLKENFKEVYSIGDEIEVEVIEITAKGISLRQKA